jgi:hypothetical protein
MSKEFPNQDPYLPPGVSPNHPNFTGPDYESEIDIDYAYKVLSWLEEAAGSVQEAIEYLVKLGELTSESANKDMEIVKQIDAIKDDLECALKAEQQKIDGEYDDFDADFAYESWRDDNM